LGVPIALLINKENSRASPRTPRLIEESGKRIEKEGIEGLVRKSTQKSVGR